MTINQTRNILYKISDQGLVSFIRKKDKRKGWYTYFWKIEVLKSLEFLRDFLTNKIDQVNNQIKSRETKQFYYCETCNVEYNEENALLKDFTCPECGNVFVLRDNSSFIKDLKKNMIRLTSELREVQDEINKEKEKLDKKKEKDTKKFEKNEKIRKEQIKKDRIKLEKNKDEKGKKPGSKKKIIIKRKIATKAKKEKSKKTNSGSNKKNIHKKK